jgi:nickel/cobalt transporter (NicO) family protein
MKKTKLLFLLALILSLTQVSSAVAHPADLYVHSIHVTLAEDGVSIKWDLQPGPMLVSFIWFEADVDMDDTISAEEAERWANTRVSLFTATLNGKPLPLQVDELQFPSSLDSFQSGAEYITIQLSAAWSQDPGDSYELVLRNGLEEQRSLNWYYITAQNEIKFQTPQQSNNLITLQVFEPTAQAAAQLPLRAAWDTSMPSLPQQSQASVAETADQTTPSLLDFVPQDQNTSQQILLNIVRSDGFSVPFFIFALGISLALGSLHALTPGHGKTVVAAYLVGSRGTKWHAIALGSVVTLTHTGSVLLLGIVTLLASQYILPTTLIPIMEILSGLLIVGLGLYLLWQRYQYWRRTRSAVAKKRPRTLSLKPVAGKMPSGRFQIQKSSLHDHSHGNMHDHGDGHVHSHEVPEVIAWRSLIALGISGGLVPCPDAIAILLVAMAINRILLGLALIASFSFGLAVVLIFIGLLMVNSRRLFDRMGVFDRVAPVLPIVSAVVVLALGAALTMGAFLQAKNEFHFAGAGSRSIQKAQVLYLAGGQDEPKQLFVTDIQPIDPVLLSGAGENVTEYALSPDQGKVVYVTQSENLENRIWLVYVKSGEQKVLSDCADAICSGLVWSPNGTRIVYEYTRLSDKNITGLPTLWWADITSGEANSVFQEAQLPGANPRWSPDGKWLSYAKSDEIRLYNLGTGESHAIQSPIASAAYWSPDSKKILYRDVILRDRLFITQLFVYDLSSGIEAKINPDLNYENLSAAWSPDGEWIAVVRRELSVPLGNQIWVMRADGSEPRALTSASGLLHNNLTWSRDGKYLLYDVFSPNSSSLESNVQMIDVETGIITDLGIIGYKAEWQSP